MDHTVCVFSPDEALPTPRAMLRSQGVPAGVQLPERVGRLVDEALQLYRDLACPRTMYRQTTQAELAEIYHGEGRNERETPIAHVFPLADRLALFAVTLGQALSTRIAALFARHDLALAAMLDAAASEGADRTVELVRQRFAAELGDASLGVLPYSPGYCGWDITGQLRLFSHLQPEQIGISLTASCLMVPLKSVSGVLVAGAAEIHRFEAHFPSCDRCTSKGCRGRMATVAREEDRHGHAPRDQ